MPILRGRACLPSHNLPILLSGKISKTYYRHKSLISLVSPLEVCGPSKFKHLRWLTCSSSHFEPQRLFPALANRDGAYRSSRPTTIGLEPFREHDTQDGA